MFCEMRLEAEGFFDVMVMHDNEAQTVDKA